MDNIQLTQPHLRYLEPPMLMRNAKGRFADVSPAAGPAFRKPLAARGVAFGDLNNDGWVDVVINCNNGPAVILENQRAGSNHWLLIDTIGTRSNRDGIGAQLRLVAESGDEQYAMVASGSSYLSSNDKRLHFGLGSAETANVQVIWPSGIQQKLGNIRSDQIIEIREPAQP